MPRPETVEVEVKIAPDLAAFVEAFRPFVTHVRAFADVLSAAFPGPHVPGLQALARANDLTIAQRRGERPCAGSHDELATVCGHCGAAL